MTDFIFLGSKITADSDCSHEIKTLVPWKKSYDQPKQHIIKKQRHYFADKDLSRLVVAFLPRNKCLNFMTADTICSDFEAQEKKICQFPFFPFLFAMK